MDLISANDAQQEVIVSEGIKQSVPKVLIVPELSSLYQIIHNILNSWIAKWIPHFKTATALMLGWLSIDFLMKWKFLTALPSFTETIHSDHNS